MHYEPVDLKDPRTGERIETVAPYPGMEAWSTFWKILVHIIRQLDVVLEQTRKPKSSGYSQQDMDDIRRI